MSWNPIGDAPANPYEIVEASSNYTIQNGELVFAESGVELTFPQPEPDGAIGVASVDGKQVDLVPQSGVIESEEERKYNKTEVSYFVSDGTDWYAVSNRELLNFIPDTLVDNFENEPNGVYGSLSDFYTNDVDDFDRNQDAPVFKGDFSLKGDSTDNSFPIIWSDLDDGLNRYPERGEKIVYETQLMSTNASSTFWFLSPNGDPRQNGYQLRIRADDDEILLARRIDGEQTNLDSTSVTVNDGTHYRVTIDLTSDDTISVTVRDVDSDSDIGTVTATDDTFDGRGIGFQVASESTLEAVWDNVRVSE